jgi:hypothetical protein
MRIDKIAIAEDGLPLSVIRPANPALAIAIAKVAVAKQDGALFQRLPVEVSDYTFVGWLSADKRCIVDENGKRIGDLQAGDSFVTGLIQSKANDRS